MLEAVELPAGVAHLAARLTNMDGDALSDHDVSFAGVKKLLQ